MKVEHVLLSGIFLHSQTFAYRYICLRKRSIKKREAEIPELAHWSYELMFLMKFLVKPLSDVVLCHFNEIKRVRGGGV